MTTRVNNGLLFDVSFLNYHLYHPWSCGLTMYVVLLCMWSYIVRGLTLYVVIFCTKLSSLNDSDFKELKFRVMRVQSFMDTELP